MMTALLLSSLSCRRRSRSWCVRSRTCSRVSTCRLRPAKLIFWERLCSPVKCIAADQKEAAASNGLAIGVTI
jgi:hypothetical protein